MRIADAPLCYNDTMDWKRLERWVTNALYIAGGTGLVILLVKHLAPERSLPQRIASDAAAYLTELGNVSGGLLIVIILCVLGGDVIMATIFRGVDRYRKWREDERRRKEEFIRVREESIAEGRAEGRAEGLADGRAEGRAEGRDAGIKEGRAEALSDVRSLLLERGIDPDDILPPEENGSEPSA